MYKEMTNYFEAVAKGYPLVSITVSSLVFKNTNKTAGTLKFFTKEEGVIFHDPKWNKEEEKYDWKDAKGHVFVCSFSKGKDGSTFVKLPGKYAKTQNANGEWVDRLNEKGKKIWKDQIVILDHNGFNKTKALKAMLSAMVDVKAGRFKYSTGSESDYYFAYRKIRDKEDTPSGYVGVAHGEIEKLRKNGIKVYIRPSAKSCANCSNCLRLVEEDDSGIINDLTSLASRPVSALIDEGPVQPDRLCLARLEMVDIEATDYINDISKEDRSEYYTSQGYKRLARPDEVVISKFQYGTRNIVTGSHEEKDEDGDIVEVKDFTEDDFEGVEEVAVDFNELKSMRMEAIADECPFWTKVDKNYGYYEWPKPDKTAIFYAGKNEWEICETNKQVRKAGREFKFSARYHGIEATYWKKSPLERQRDFLKKVENWIDNPTETDDTEKWVKRFNEEKPVESLASRWDEVLNRFADSI